MTRLLLLFLLLASSQGRNIDSYFKDRQRLLAQENNHFLGSDLKLDTHEVSYNEDLMKMKQFELAQAFHTANFPPSQFFYKVKADIEQSAVFNAIFTNSGVFYTDSNGLEM